MSLTGRILWYDEREGYGVIEDFTGNEFYFDSSVWKCPVSDPSRSRLVRFEANPTIKHVACAMNVRDLLTTELEP